jgi:very-short-patch-repair endonuclease
MGAGAPLWQDSRRVARADCRHCAWCRDPRGVAAGRSYHRGNQVAAAHRGAASRASWRLPRRTPSAERRGALPCGSPCLWRAGSAERAGGCAPGRCPKGRGTTAGGDHAHRAPCEGVKTRRSRRMSPEDATTWRGIPVTTVARTLLDLAGVLPVDDLARACHEAGVRHGTTAAEVEAVLARRPGSRGAAKLRRILHGDVRVALSRLEARFLARLREAHLAMPQTNRLAGGRRVDCRWPAQRLTVELDGYRYHCSRHSWEQDRRREREARARGDEFRRYTYGDVFEDPRFMLAELRALLPTSCPA